MNLEVVVETVEDAIAAAAGGADQLEVKCDYLEYGLTPSPGMLEAIIQQVQCNVLCMIRPHARSLVYSSHDLDVMKNDIQRLKELPFQGFLLGCLTADGELDIPALVELRDSAHSYDVHFHLGWEQTNSPLRSLETLIDLGFGSVRTSGGQGISGNAVDNTARIKEYLVQTGGRMNLFLAGGIRLNNVQELVVETGVPNLHIGSGVRDPESRTGRVSAEKVSNMKELLSTMEI